MFVKQVTRGIALLLVVLVSSSQAMNLKSTFRDGTAIDWNHWSDHLLQQSMEQNRPILLTLSADWCGFCKKMNETTWQDEQVVKSVSDHYIPIRIKDTTDPEMASFYAHYGVPGMVILDGEENEVIKRTGYIEPQQMVWMLEAVAQNPTLEANR